MLDRRDFQKTISNGPEIQVRTRPEPNGLGSKSGPARNFPRKNVARGPARARSFSKTIELDQARAQNEFRLKNRCTQNKQNFGFCGLFCSF